MRGLLRYAAQAVKGGLKGSREGKAEGLKNRRDEEDRIRDQVDRQRNIEEDVLRRSMLEFNFGQAQSGAQARSAGAQQDATELAALRGQDPGFANLSREAIERQLGERAKPQTSGGNIDPLSDAGIAATVKRDKLMQAQAPKKEPDPTGAQAKSAGLFSGAVQANAGLAPDKVPGGLSRAYSDVARFVVPERFESYFLTEKQEQFKQAGDQFADMVLRSTSGANTPEAEVQKYLGFLIPSGGEGAGTQKQKSEARQTFMKALQTAGGDAVSPDDVVKMLQQASGGGASRGASAVARLRAK